MLRLWGKKKTTEDFYNSLLVKGFSDVTVDNYKRVLKKFVKETSVNPSKKQVEECIAGLRKKKCSYSHILNTSVVLERYMDFLGRSLKLGRTRRPRTIVKDILTEGEIARIIAAVKNSREKAIIAVLAYSGIRNKEMCDLKVKNVDLDSGVVKVFGGKGNKSRIAYIPRECVRIVSEYERDYKKAPEDLFIRTLVNKNQYSGGDLRKMVKVVAKRANVGKRVFPHLFRHSLATNLLKNGASLITIQNQLGHSKIETTMIYIRSFPQRAQAEYQYYLPSYI